MFRRQYCAIFRELTVPDQICYTNVMDTKTGASDSRCSFTRNRLMYGLALQDKHCQPYEWYSYTTGVREWMKSVFNPLLWLSGY
jgi:hypothetical protein